MANDYRDPLVGRDVLFGLLLGLVSTLVSPLWTLAPSLIGQPGNEPSSLDGTILLSLRGAIEKESFAVFSGLMNGLFLMFGLTQA